MLEDLLTICVGAGRESSGGGTKDLIFGRCVRIVQNHRVEIIVFPRFGVPNASARELMICERDVCPTERV